MINNKSDGQQFWTTYSPGCRSWGRINTLCSKVGEPKRPELHDLVGAGTILFFLQEPEHFKKLE